MQAPFVVNMTQGIEYYGILRVKRLVIRELEFQQLCFGCIIHLANMRSHEIGYYSIRASLTATYTTHHDTN